MFTRTNRGIAWAMICKLEQNPSPSAYLSDFSTLNGTFLAWFLVLMTCLFQGFEAFYLFASYENCFLSPKQDQRKWLLINKLRFRWKTSYFNLPRNCVRRSVPRLVQAAAARTVKDHPQEQPLNTRPDPPGSVDFPPVLIVDQFTRANSVSELF